MSARTRTRGFTLTELLVVLAIIILLMALLLVALRAVRQAGAEATCLQQLHQISVVLKNYTDQTHSIFPRAEAWGLGGATAQDTKGVFAPAPGLPGAAATAIQRPLNQYMQGERRLELFQCPSDWGIVGLDASLYPTTFHAAGSSYVYLARGAGYPGLTDSGLPGAGDSPADVGVDIRGVAGQSRADFTNPAAKLVVMEPQLYMAPTSSYNWSMDIPQNQRHAVRTVRNVGGFTFPQGTALFMDGHAIYLVRQTTPDLWPVLPNQAHPEHEWW
jgi:prepilin-type N-terminal cleavage/methylation domain-containing protein